MRMGSSGIDHAAQTVSDAPESVVVGVEEPDVGDWMPWFVSLARAAVRDDCLRSTIRIAIRAGALPRRLRDDILPIGAVPHTLTGKRLRYPSSAPWLGQRPPDVVDRVQLTADVLVEIADLAAARSPS